MTSFIIYPNECSHPFEAN
uniref:Uncharacterized protein n=1 Tax=Anguilla anguilla TaxID=7936 RepID=A0A0E9QRA2_ANGAN